MTMGYSPGLNQSLRRTRNCPRPYTKPTPRPSMLHENDVGARRLATPRWSSSLEKIGYVSVLKMTNAVSTGTWRPSNLMVAVCACPPT